MKNILAPVVILTASCLVNVHANDNKPIRIIVPYTAGTITDNLARNFARSLGNSSGQPVMVENIAGADGVVGVQAFLRAEPHEKVVLFTGNSVTVVNPLTKKSISYNPQKDFEAVCGIAKIDNILNVGPSVKSETLADFIKDAKANPGKYTYGYSSATIRVASELFAQTAGIKLSPVPYKSTVTALTEVSSGQVDMFFTDQSSAGAFYLPGKIRPMLISGDKRLASLPSVPSASEVGLAAYSIVPWYATYVPAKMNPSLKASLMEELKKASKSEETKKSLEAVKVQSFPVCGADLQAYLQADIALIKGIVEKAQIEKN